MKVLLDTHAAVWAAELDDRLGAGARRALRGCAAEDAAISDVTPLEVAMLVSKGRLKVVPSLARYLGALQSNFRVLPIDAAVAAQAVELDLPQGDPFDRIIVATARHHRIPLLTRDAAITASGLVDVVW